MAPKTTLREWRERFDEMWYDDSFGGIVAGEVKDFIGELLASQKALLVEKVEELKKDIHPETSEGDEGYMTALDDVLALIREQH